MHFRALVIVELLEPVLGPGRGGEKEYSSYAQSLGINAPDMAQAASIAQEFILTRDPRVAAITSAEFEALAYSEVPTKVVENASSS